MKSHKEVEIVDRKAKRWAVLAVVMVFIFIITFIVGTNTGSKLPDWYVAALTIFVIGTALAFFRVITLLEKRDRLSR